MNSKVLPFLCVLLITSSVSLADDEKTKVAIGGGVGGAIGAVIGEEIGDREGAIIGSALGAAIGTAVATQESGSEEAISGSSHVEISVNSQKKHPKSRHCPPGQAKKGRC